jgi:hypothetical protein
MMGVMIKIDCMLDDKILLYDTFFKNKRIREHIL